jgi:hypothetical protein
LRKAYNLHDLLLSLYYGTISSTFKKNIDVDDLTTCVINSAIKKINFNIHYYRNTDENEFEYEVFFQKDSIPYEHEMNVDGHSLFLVMCN